MSLSYEREPPWLYHGAPQYAYRPLRSNRSLPPVYEPVTHSVSSPSEGGIANESLSRDLLSSEAEYSWRAPSAAPQSWAQQPSWGLPSSAPSTRLYKGPWTFDPRPFRSDGPSHFHSQNSFPAPTAAPAATAPRRTPRGRREFVQSAPNPATPRLGAGIGRAEEFSGKVSFSRGWGAAAKSAARRPPQGAAAPSSSGDLLQSIAASLQAIASRLDALEDSVHRGAAPHAAAACAPSLPPGAADPRPQGPPSNAPSFHSAKHRPPPSRRVPAKGGEPGFQKRESALSSASSAEEPLGLQGEAAGALGGGEFERLPPQQPLKEPRAQSADAFGRRRGDTAAGPGGGEAAVCYYSQSPRSRKSRRQGASPTAPVAAAAEYGGFSSLCHGQQPPLAPASGSCGGPYFVSDRGFFYTPHHRHPTRGEGENPLHFQPHQQQQLPFAPPAEAGGNSAGVLSAQSAPLRGTSQRPQRRFWQQQRAPSPASEGSSPGSARSSGLFGGGSGAVPESVCWQEAAAGHCPKTAAPPAAAFPCLQHSRQGPPQPEWGSAPLPPPGGIEFCASHPSTFFAAGAPPPENVFLPPLQVVPPTACRETAPSPHVCGVPMRGVFPVVAHPPVCSSSAPDASGSCCCAVPPCAFDPSLAISHPHAHPHPFPHQQTTLLAAASPPPVPPVSFRENCFRVATPCPPQQPPLVAQPHAGSLPATSVAAPAPRAGSARRLPCVVDEEPFSIPDEVASPQRTRKLGGGRRQLAQQAPAAKPSCSCARTAGGGEGASSLPASVPAGAGGGAAQHRECRECDREREPLDEESSAESAAFSSDDFSSAEKKRPSQPLSEAPGAAAESAESFSSSSPPASPRGRSSRGEVPPHSLLQQRQLMREHQEALDEDFERRRQRDLAKDVADWTETHRRAGAGGAAHGAFSSSQGSSSVFQSHLPPGFSAASSRHAPLASSQGARATAAECSCGRHGGGREVQQRSFASTEPFQTPHFCTQARHQRAPGSSSASSQEGEEAARTPSPVLPHSREHVQEQQEQQQERKDSSSCSMLLRPLLLRGAEAEAAASKGADACCCHPGGAALPKATPRFLQREGAEASVTDLALPSKTTAKAAAAAPPESLEGESLNVRFGGTRKWLSLSAFKLRSEKNASQLAAPSVSAL